MLEAVEESLMVDISIFKGMPFSNFLENHPPPPISPKLSSIILVLQIRFSINCYFNYYTYYTIFSPFLHRLRPNPGDQEMAVPEVDKKLVMELQSMGFPLARATRALHYSGNSSLEDAVTWIIDHENDPDIDQMPFIPMEIDIEAPDSFDITEEVKERAEKLRNGGDKEQGTRGHESREEREEITNLVRKSREERERELEREREKERRRSGKQLLEAKHVAEENARKRMIALKEVEKAEERRARERIRQKLEADKAERRSRQGLLPDASVSAQTNDSNLAIPAVPRKSSSTTKRSATRAELLSECLRTLRRSCEGDDAKAKKAFETLQIYVRNVINFSNQRKYRRIRLTNPIFQDRIGSLRGGIRFLELCGFEKTTSQFLYLPRDKVDMAVLNAAMRSLQSALTNPYFGLLSIELPETSSTV